MSAPIVGVTVDNRDNTAGSGAYESSIAYSTALAEAGCLPVLLPHEPDAAADYVTRCDAIVLTGGVDPRTEPFGEATHPRARPVDQRRQQFEMALLDACDRDHHKPVLGVCLGMQMMALHHGGRLHQYLPEVLAHPQVHEAYSRHAIVLRVSDSVLCPAAVSRKSQVEGLKSRNAAQAASQTPSETCDLRLATCDFEVVSQHRQAVADPGTLRIAAVAPDGVIEAIDDATRPFYLGVQWHPERGDMGPVNRGLFARLLEACRAGPGRCAT